MPFEVAEHTADLKIRVWGNSLEDLFREAVLAMMKLVKNEVVGSSTEERKINIDAPDGTALLIDFLNEVLTLSQTSKEVYRRVSFTEFSPVKLEAVLQGIKVNDFDEDIKAVTYHEADVKRNDKGEWETILIFDI